MINRRQLLLMAASAALLPKAIFASSDAGKKLGWREFKQQMSRLADERLVAGLEQEAVSERGLAYLQQLDIQSPDFMTAVEDSYESGNRYWLWQRLMKAHNINGGILNIDSDQLVQLHDHPGATGMVRIISGEVEVWQFDEVEQNRLQQKQGVAELRRFSHGTLKAGDTAVLTPKAGNIHALRSISKQCRMLDFFIPPYQRSDRHWYQPLTKNWSEQETVACKKIAQQDYADA